jgi:cytochrome c oxidase subunit 4
MSEQSHPTPLLYAIILLILVAGTCLTYWAATQDFGVGNPVIALAIACTKATLVILFFMHVRYSSRLTKLTVVAGFFWLLIMITMSLSDYLTRAFSF